MTVIELHGVTKTYRSDPPVDALKGVDLSVGAGERLAILGPSGSGKSTLMNILGLLDVPTSGSYALDGHEVAALREAQHDRLRAKTLGFVFQDAHVLGHRTVRENLEIKLAVSRVARRERSRLVQSSLEQVGLQHRVDALGRLLSGGERQRLAIARAVSTSPAVLLADEPTGNLDPANTRSVLEIFDEQARAGVAVVVITHDLTVAGWADRWVSLEDGVVRAPGGVA